MDPGRGGDDGSSISPSKSKAAPSSTPVGGGGWSLIGRARKAQLNAGLSALGKEVWLPAFSGQRGSVLDWETADQRWIVSSKEVIRDVFPQDYTSGRVHTMADSGLSIMLPGSVSADEDFQGHSTVLSLHGGKVNVKNADQSTPQKTDKAVLHLHSKSDEQSKRETGVKIAAQVDWHRNQAGQEGCQVKHAQVAKGRAGFTYARPFLRLHIPSKDYIKTPHVTEVLLGVKLEGSLHDQGRSPTMLPEDCITTSTVKFGNPNSEKGQQQYDMQISVSGPDVSEKKLKDLDMNQVLAYITNTWGPQAQFMPEHWKVLYIRVCGSCSATQLTARDLANKPVEEEMQSDSTATGSALSSVTSSLLGSKKSKCDLQNRMEQGMSFPELRLGKSHNIPNGVFNMFEELHILDDVVLSAASANVTAGEVLWALKKCGDVFKDTKLKPLFVLVISALQRKDTHSCNVWASAMARSQHFQWLCDKNPAVKQISENAVGTQGRQQLREYAANCRVCVAVGIAACDVLEHWGKDFTAEDQAFLTNTAGRLNSLPITSPELGRSLFDRYACRYVIVEHTVQNRTGWDATFFVLDQCPRDVLSRCFEAPWRGPGREVSFFQLYPSFIQYRDPDSAELFISRLVRAYSSTDANFLGSLKNFMEDGEADARAKMDFLISFVSACRRAKISPQKEESTTQGCFWMSSRAPKQEEVGPAPDTEDVDQLILELVLKDYATRQSMPSTFRGGAAEEFGGDGADTGFDDDLGELYEACLLLSSKDNLWAWATRQMDDESQTAEDARKFVNAVGMRHVAVLLRTAIIAAQQAAANPSPAGSRRGSKAAVGTEAIRYDDAEARELIEGKLWMHDGRKLGQFAEHRTDPSRASADFGQVLRMHLKLEFALGGDSVYTFVQLLEEESEGGTGCFEAIAPNNSSLRRAICKDVRRSLNCDVLQDEEIDALLSYTGFFSRSFQGFLRNTKAVEDAKEALNSSSLRRISLPASWHKVEGNLFALQATLAKLISVQGQRKGKSSLDELTINDVIAELKDQIRSSADTWTLICKMIGAILRPDFKNDGGFGLKQFVDCVNELGKAGKLLAYKKSKGVSEQLVDNVSSVIDSFFVQSAPSAWISSLRSLDTVVFTLEHMGKEDLNLTYERFEVEFKQGGDDGQLRELTQCVKKIYHKPLAAMNHGGMSADMNMKDIIAKEAVALKDKIKWKNCIFKPEDWTKVLEIAGEAAEAMKQQYHVMMLPHHTQMITLIMFAIRVCGKAGKGIPKTMLARVGTGEGKSLIIGMLAAFIAKKGMRAHVVNKSKVLTLRDYNSNSRFFSKLGIQAGTEKKDLKNQKCSIVYCTGDEVEDAFMETLLDGTSDAYQKGLKEAVLISDEVDGLLIDGGTHKVKYCEDTSLSEQVNEWLQQLENTGKIEQDWTDFRARDECIQEMQQEVEDAFFDSMDKVEGKDYTKRGERFYMLDPNTAMLSDDWSLWFEILKCQQSSQRYVKYQYKKAILCRLQCFMSYSCVFGLTGSLGQQAEKNYVGEQYQALSFNVPYFLDTCRGEGGKVYGKQPVKQISNMDPLPDQYQQDEAVTELSADKCKEVPVLMIARDPDAVERLVVMVKQRLKKLYGDTDEKDNVIKLLHNPKKPEEFVELVRRATEPMKIREDVDLQAPRQAWRVTITTAEGGRGHDYRVVDPTIDEKGGLLVILTSVPYSEREWIQQLGRTGRQDHVGQYACLLNAEDEEVDEALKYQVDGETIEETILRNGDEDTALKFETANQEISKVRLMHKLTSRYWTLHKGDKTTKQQNWEWRRLCMEFLEYPDSDIVEVFEAIFPGAPPLEDDDMEEEEHAPTTRNVPAQPAKVTTASAQAPSSAPKASASAPKKAPVPEKAAAPASNAGPIIAAQGIMRL